jgi:hypothetical protein
VPKRVHEIDPTFFPPLKQWFLVQTVDGELWWCVMAQAERKGIHTPEDNSTLGRYFRRKLGLKDGALVTRDDLLKYGRTDVTILKLDSNMYILDFEP